MRHLLDNERALIDCLLKVSGCGDEGLNAIQVEVVNEETGTIRSTHLANKEPTKAVADTSFTDVDGTHVEVILFVDAKGSFGELFIWKVDDTPLISMPTSIDEYRECQSIKR